MALQTCVQLWGFGFLTSGRAHKQSFVKNNPKDLGNIELKVSSLTPNNLIGDSFVLNSFLNCRVCFYVSSKRPWQDVELQPIPTPKFHQVRLHGVRHPFRQLVCGHVLLVYIFSHALAAALREILAGHDPNRNAACLRISHSYSN